MMARTTRTAATVLALLALVTAEAAAHGEATLKSPVKSVAAGASLTLDGDDFEPGESQRLLLKGALRDYELGTASASADSTFSLQVVVPGDVRPGQYRVVAMAPDGDEVATLDMTVTAASSAADEGHEHMDPAPGGSGHASAEARADDIVVERNRSGVEWGLIGLIIGLAGGLGVGLLARG